MVDREINLEETVQPFGLLLVVNTLNQMNPGEILDIIIPDIEILDSILRIVRHSQNVVLDYCEIDTGYGIRIQKGDSRKTRTEEEGHGQKEFF